METMLQDVRYAVRRLRGQPAFSTLCALTLALGIGVSTALFSVIDAALLRPLPYPHPEQLVAIDVGHTVNGRASRGAPAMSDVRTWRTLDAIVSHAGMGRVSGFVPLIVDTGTPERLTVAEASEDFLETYGVTPVVGRGIQAADTRQGAPPVALLGHAYWQRAFGGRADVLGSIVRIQDQPVTVIGVLPAGFYPETAVWRAMQFSSVMLDRRQTGVPVIARLRPGVTLAQAGAALEAVTPASAARTGAASVPTRVIVDSMYADETRGFGATIRTLSLAVGLILVIACVNVAGLTLARGATRHVEMAIRTAVGARRGRLVRQLLTESLLLALAGALVGVLCAYASLDSLVALIPLFLPANAPVEINTTALAFALGLTAVTGLLAGLAPALKLSDAPGAIGAMRPTGGRGGGPLSRRAGQWLIGVEVAVALVLMTAAGLILQSFVKLVSVDQGFNTANLLTLEVEPLDQSAAVRRAYYAALGKTLRQLPEVMSAGAIDRLALTGGASYYATTADTGVRVDGPQRMVLPGYLEALGVRALSGRLLEDADSVRGDAVVVNETASRQYFDGHALGHSLRVGNTNARQLRIVGVVPDIRHGNPQRPVEPQMYVLPDPGGDGASSKPMAMVMRLRDGASLSFDMLKQTAESVGPRVLVGKARPAAALLGEQVARPRHRMLLLTMLGVFALLLTVVGIFGVTACAVARRTHEVGVRVALGASRADVVRVMLGDAALPVACGLLAGLAGTCYAMRIISSFLFQTTPHDPVTLAAVVALLGAAACVAAWLPARRAASIDPVAALRAE